jgi:hypothetical protein
MVRRIKLLIIAIVVVIIFVGCNMNNLPEGELKNTVKSPNGKYMVNLYLCDGGATTDYAVRGEIVYSEKEKKTIYWNYHCEETEASWLDNENVIINGIELNIFEDEYDWREE